MTRKDVWERLDTVKAVVEEGFKHLADAVAQYGAANRAMKEATHRFGIDSFGWLNEENGISGTEELVRFIACPEHAHFLEVFYSALAPETAALLKQEVARCAMLG